MILKKKRMEKSDDGGDSRLNEKIYFDNLFMYGYTA